MAYNEKLANRIREELADIPKTEESQIMGGLTFMVNGKMCVGIIKDELMCRIEQDAKSKLKSKVVERWISRKDQ